MLAHWKNNVQADGSILDGYTWKDNGDGTFTPMDRGVRYGALDQYGMGLRAGQRGPPFFMLEAMTDMEGRPVMTGFARSGRYRAQRVDLTIDDIIRANGPREPESDPAAEDLRMGVVLLGAPGLSADQLDRRGLPDRQHPPPVDRLLQQRRRRPGQGLHRAAAPLPRATPTSSASSSWSRPTP